jgi:hypothetical protein
VIEVRKSILAYYKIRRHSVKKHHKCKTVDPPDNVKNIYPPGEIFFFQRIYTIHFCRVVYASLIPIGIGTKYDGFPLQGCFGEGGYIFKKLIEVKKSSKHSQTVKNRPFYGKTAKNEKSGSLIIIIIIFLKSK